MVAFVFDRQVRRAAQQIRLRLCNTYNRAADFLTPEADSTDVMGEWLLGLTAQFSAREDMMISEDMRQFLFGPVSYNRRDLAAINVQRGRDHGVADYNTVRMAYGLARRTAFSDITPDPTIAAKLTTLYSNSTANIDLFVGGMAETIDGPGSSSPRSSWTSSGG